MTQTQARAPQPKTLEEHKQFLQDMTRLQLWFIEHWLKSHPQETVAYCLLKRVDIIRRTVFNTGPLENTYSAGMHEDPQWQSLVARLGALYDATRSASAGTFENEGWKLLEPYVLPRAEGDVNRPDPLENFQCGSLRYDLTPTGDPPRVSFHIGNRIKPQSIFADPAYLPRCFRQMIHAVRTEVGAKVLNTGTWLNSLPAWLELFPQEWIDNMSEPNMEITWSMGHWGQFINARGLMNHRYAAQFRQAGLLPYYHRSSRCSIDALEAHLDQLDAKRGIQHATLKNRLTESTPEYLK